MVEVARYEGIHPSRLLHWDSKRSTSKYDPPILTSTFTNFLLVIRNLYHIVFQNDCQEVVVYDNCLRVVKGPIVLQEDQL